MHQGSQKIRQKSVKKSVENKKQSLGSPVENSTPVLGARATNAKSLADSSSKDSSTKQFNGNSDSKDTSEDPSEDNIDTDKYPSGDKREVLNKNSESAVKVDEIDFIAECYYKTVTFSPEDFQKRLQQFNLGPSPPTGDISKETACSNSVQPAEPSCSIPKRKDIIDHNSSNQEDQDIESLSSPPSQQSLLMLSAAERQELAENAMEQLASGLNKAAEAMQSGEEEEAVGEVKPDLANLQDKELFQLLEEAYSYKSKKDRQGKSEIFRELLEKAEENSSGEEQWDINFRKHLHHQDSTGKKKKKKVSESSKKGGSLSNLSCLSDFESSSSGRSGKNKKCRSSVSSRSREGGSLPPTKFENVMLFEGGSNAPPPPTSFAWDTGGKVMPGESGLLDGGVTPGELQPLLHSTSDSMLRKLLPSSTETCIDMEHVANGECDTDSNKTEVEEIEMVDMEGRDLDTAEQADDETTPLLQARHRMETRGRVIGNHGPEEGIELQSGWSSVRSVTEGGQEREGDNKPEMDENGNPTTYTNGSSNGPFPIMDPQLRPLSIYRHTPVFRPQKLTVPSMQPEHNHSEDKSKVEGKRKVRRKKEEEKNVVKAEDIEGYRGNKDIDSILEFIDGENGGKKKKSGDKLIEKNKKNNAKSDINKDDKVRKKKEKSLEKDNLNKPSVTKKLSVDNCVENDVIEEDPEMDQEDRGISVDTDATRPSVSPEKDSMFPAPTLEVDVKGAEGVKSPVVPMDTLTTSVKPSPSLASSGRANSAPSNDSGHVSAEPCSLPSVSSTKEMSIASSPPLDLDHVEFVSEESCSQETTNTEFTKVTKKQRKKKSGSIRERPDRTYQSGSAFSEENRSRGGDDEGRVASSTRRSQLARGSTQAETEEWSFRGYNRIRGSREAVSGAKSTCSVPPSDASDTDDHDSVHSLPVGSTRKKVSAPTHSVSSGHTPQASYADIARHAAALYTQQAGQQQHAVYREQLQFRDTTPSNTKESVSSTEGDSMSFSYCPPDLDSTFPPVPTHTHPIPGYPGSIVSPPHGHLARAASEPSDSVYHVESENNNTNSFIEVKSNNASQENSNLPPKMEDKITENKNSEDHNPGSKVARSSQSNIKPSSTEVKQSSPEINLPPVVILNSSRDNLETEGGFTFGFEVNESLLAMSCADKCQISDKVSENGDKSEPEKVGKSESMDIAQENVAHQKAIKSIEDSPSAVNNQNYEDNEMMKNLLSCTKKSQDSYADRPSEPSDNVMVNEETNVNTFDEDDVDVVVESQPFDDTKGVSKSTYDFTAFYRDIDSTDHTNFNYDVIVSFVQQAWDVVSKELKSGSPVIYYSS